MAKIYKYTCPVCGKKFETNYKSERGCCSRKCSALLGQRKRKYSDEFIKSAIELGRNKFITKYKKKYGKQVENRWCSFLSAARKRGIIKSHAHELKYTDEKYQKEKQDIDNREALLEFLRIKEIQYRIVGKKIIIEL